MIEPHYRAGIRSLKDMGAEFGVSDAAIVKHAQKNGWDRNLKAKIQAKADAKVSAALVSAEVSAETKLTESARIEVEAEIQARIRIGHRADISRSRQIAMQLLAELEHQINNGPLLEELLDLVIPLEEDSTKNATDRAIKLREAFNKATSLGGRTKTMKDLADTLKTLVALESAAYGLAEMAPPSATPDNADPTDVARRLAFVFASGMHAQPRTIQ